MPFWVFYHLILLSKKLRNKINLFFYSFLFFLLFLIINLNFCSYNFFNCFIFFKTLKNKLFSLLTKHQILLLICFFRNFFFLNRKLIISFLLKLLLSLLHYLICCALIIRHHYLYRLSNRILLIRLLLRNYPWLHWLLKLIWI